MSDPTKRPERLSIAAFIATLVLLLMAIGLGYFVAQSYVMLTAITSLLVANAFSFISWWHSLLVRKELTEKDEQQRIRDSYEREDLFGDEQDALRMAESSHKQFDRWFITLFTLASGIGLILRATWFQWRNWLEMEVSRNALQAAGMSFFLLIFCLLAGSYFNGLSREKGNRFLRPVAAWLLLTAVTYLLVFLVMLGEHFEIGNWDLLAARAMLVLHILFGIELLFNFVIEFYRPRVPGEEERPLYESRLLGLFTEPGGMARNVAHALDYQFGFKVSETWFYSFLERAVIPICFAIIVTLYLLSSVVKIEANELGLKERFSKPMAGKVLEPGLHLKWPWPIDRIRVYPVNQIQTLKVGYTQYAEGETHEPDPANPEEQVDDTGGQVIVWNKHHFKEETRFLVATRDLDEGTTQTQSVPVNFLTTGLKIHYLIDADQLPAYAYNYEDPARVLEKIASREMVRYLSSVDFIDVIGREHDQARQTLQERITSSVEDLQPPLGVEIKFAILHGSHPPVEVATSFQDVVAANEERSTMKLQAEADAAQTVNLSAGTRAQAVADARAYQIQMSEVPMAEAELFTAQLELYRQAPRVFLLRSYLEALQQVPPETRKYLTTSGTYKQILELNLEEKLRPDMLQDLDLNAPDN